MKRLLVLMGLLVLLLASCGTSNPRSLPNSKAISPKGFSIVEIVPDKIYWVGTDETLDVTERVQIFSDAIIAISIDKEIISITPISLSNTKHHSTTALVVIVK